MAVSIPYWLGSKLRGRVGCGPLRRPRQFQSPIGWGLSCELIDLISKDVNLAGVSIPYWLGSKLRARRGRVDCGRMAKFQSPIGWGLSCELLCQ